MNHTYTLRQQADGSWKATQHAMQGRDYPRPLDYPDLVIAQASRPGDVTMVEYVAPAPAPEPTPADLLAQTDQELLGISARTLEDMIQERIDAGKFVAQPVKDKIAERKALRSQL